MIKENSRTSITLDGYEVMATVRRIADEQAGFVPHDHALVHVAKGTLEVLRDGRPMLSVAEGECVFIRKDHRIRMRRKVDAENGFHLSIFVYFSRRYLFGQYKSMPTGTLPAGIKRGEALVKIDHTPAVASLFESFRPYYYSGVNPDSQWLMSRLDEALRIVMTERPEACASLFNFASPYRPDLLEFMEEYYMYDLTGEELAQGSGRSLATFKRDFAKVSPLTPQQWVMQRRLKAARQLLLTSEASVRTIMTMAGFKNFSHFSRLYHRTYGETPSQTRKREA